MRRFLVFVVAISLMTPAPSVFAAAARVAHMQSEGSISGTARTLSGQTMANATVRLRDLSSGRLAGTTMSNGAGQFTFGNLPPGTYAVEVVNAAGDIVGTSAAIPLVAGAQVTGIGVAGSAAAASVAGGSFFGSTAGIVLIAAAGAAVAGVTVAATNGTTSPSR